jgi:hypothetical protein
VGAEVIVTEGEATASLVGLRLGGVVVLGALAGRGEGVRAGGTGTLTGAVGLRLGRVIAVTGSTGAEGEWERP